MPRQAGGDRGLASARATEVEDLEGVGMLSAGGANNMAGRRGEDIRERTVKGNS